MSTDEYTPPTEVVRTNYARRGRLDEVHPEWLAAFDRWLAEHDRQVAEQAAREIAAGFDDAGAASWIGQRIRNAADAYARADSAAPDERDATPDEAHDIGYVKGHTDGYREAMAEAAARPAPTDMDGAPLRPGVTYYTGQAGTSMDMSRAQGRPAPTVNAADVEKAANALRAHLHGHPSNGSEADHWRAAVRAALAALGLTVADEGAQR